LYWIKNFIAGLVPASVVVYTKEYDKLASTYLSVVSDYKKLDREHRELEKSLFGSPLDPQFLVSEVRNDS
jgi:hypothetical protein